MVHGLTRQNTAFPPGDILQVQVATLAGSLSLSSSIPSDNTIPQISEGTQILSKSITPTRTDSSLIIYAYAHTSVIDAERILALFKNTATDAIAACGCRPQDTEIGPSVLMYSCPTGSLDLITFSLRCGVGSAGTAYLNDGILGVAGNDLGGTITSGLLIYEVAGQ